MFKKNVVWEELYFFRKELAVQHVFISSTKRSDHSNTRLAIQIEKDAGMAWEFAWFCVFGKCDVFTPLRLCL